MADTKISALPASTTPLAGTETLPVVQSGTTKKVSVANLTAGRQVGMSSYNMGITAFTPTAAGTISDGTDNSTTEKITELLVVADDNTWKTSGASFATYRTWLNTTGIRMRVSNGAARYSSWDFTPAGNIQQLVAGEGINFTANTPAAGMTSQLLNWYEEGTWTPTVTFGDGNTGITYGAQVARYTRIGRLVTFEGQIALSSKGSSTGVARIEGLPFTTSSVSGLVRAVTIWAQNLSGVSGSLAGQLADNTNRFALSYLDTGSSTNLTDTNFTNTSILYITGSYTV